MQEGLASSSGLAFMNCSKCGEVCSCVAGVSEEEVIAEAATDESEPKLGEVSEVAKSDSDPGAWRDELSERLSRYRTRRKAPPPRYPSLKLPFERVAYPSRAAAAESNFPAFEAKSDQALALDGVPSEPVPSALIEVEKLPAPRRTTAIVAPSAKIIEFPRFAWAPPPPPPDQLAEPVGEQLRILEVPEFQPPPPALGGIMIEPVPAEPIEKQLGIDIPLQIAPLERRLAAAAVDGVIIASASALFGFIFWKIAAVRPPQVQLVSLGAGMLAVFWALYQFLLIVYSGSTPGLGAAGLELTRFDGTGTSRSVRRWRILAGYLSALSLGMGYAWVFLDEDGLCWHDRITRTHFGMKKKTQDC
jgi:hypothetical protein